MIDHELFVAVADSWVGTPFHIQGRAKNAGCDCVGLVLGISQELGINSRLGGSLANYDITDYDYARGNQLILELLPRHFFALDSPRNESILVLELMPNWYHAAIMTADFILIHACMKRQKVIKHRMPFDWLAKIKHILAFDPEAASRSKNQI